MQGYTAEVSVSTHGGRKTSLKVDSSIQGGFVWCIIFVSSYTVSLIGLKGLANKRSIWGFNGLASGVLKSSWKCLTCWYVSWENVSQTAGAEIHCKLQICFSCALLILEEFVSCSWKSVVTALIPCITHSNIHISSAAWGTWQHWAELLIEADDLHCGCLGLAPNLITTSARLHIGLRHFPAPPSLWDCWEAF